MFKQFSILLMALLIANNAYSELVIRVTEGNDKPTVIALSPFDLNGLKMNDNIADIVASDLRRSGLFKLIPQEDMLAFPSTPTDVYFRDWRLLGAEYLVVGSMSELTDGRYELEFSLLSINSQKIQFTHKVRSSATKIRDLAHSVSDKIYQSITGIRGAFSTRLAYVSVIREGDDFTYRLKVADADGARENLMLESKQPIMSPSWSPDGKELAYVSFETGRPAIFRQNLATASRQQLTSFKGLNGAPSWSPDGENLALVLSKDGNPELYNLELASGKLTRLTRHFAIDTEPAWMPDGKHILFTSDRGGTPQIYKLKLADRSVERITFQGNYNARASIAPDGRTMAMVHRSSKVFHIAALDLKTRRLIELTETTLDESPSVAPNGAMLMYATKYKDRGILAAVSVDAGVKYNLPAKLGDVREPAWSPFLR
ncbi:MAG: Tol-Pal system beta propeller repeat protein TolB [Porticoccaceae bacterium]